MSDLTPMIIGILTEHRHKAARVQARLVAELVDQHRPAPQDNPETVIHDKTEPDPEAWVEFRDRLRHDPFGALLDGGLATTRNRTHNAMRALGLNPAEVRAVVIEHDTLRVYRYQPGLPQTVPILDKESA